MKTIWKYELPMQEDVYLQMPEGAEVLSVGEQHGRLCLWALVDDNACTEGRAFSIRGTGYPADGVETQTHIGTVVTAGGALVWHVFEQ